ncbi:putative Ribosomal protein S17 [Seiridium cardinale]|uniref:Ribosomal protein S17 n=1 Tax=Seiridium cardinale TaxID=138064 RepID=A0ABR2XGD7_9PEZI
MAAPARTAAASLSAKALTHASNSGRQLIGSKTAVVVKAGTMDKTVKVRLWGQRWEKQVQKSFQVPTYHLVHDPNNSVRQGDVINISAGWRASQHVRHIVRHIIAPHGPPIDERPPVLNEEQLYEEYAAKREAKLERRAERDAAVRKEREAEKAARLERRARREEWEQSRVEAKEKKLEELRATIGDVY